ncbi:MAG: MinD/ParA family protein [Gammaproteobacteria bacterium]|nr:MinD/ParA family protein [Gammaproteobacteria bacterium]
MSNQKSNTQQHKPARILAIASGKGGVGKSCIATNLSTALVSKGHRAALLDADTGLSNADIMLGLKPELNLSHVVSGQCTIADIVINNDDGLLVIPAASGLPNMVELNIHEQAGIIRGLSVIDNQVDFLVIDMPAGISTSTINFARAAQEIVVVVCDEPASLADAKAFIQLLAEQYKVFNFHILCNMVSSLEDGMTLYKRLCEVLSHQPNVTLTHLGSIPYDIKLKQAIQRQKTVVKFDPNALSSKQLFNIIQTIESWTHHNTPRGCLEFFIERLIRFNCIETHHKKNTNAK